MYILHVLFIVPPPIQLMITDGIILIVEPKYAHGIILNYQVVAMTTSSETVINSLNISSTLFITASSFLTAPGDYLVKV